MLFRSVGGYTESPVHRKTCDCDAAILVQISPVEYLLLWQDPKAIFDILVLTTMSGLALIVLDNKPTIAIDSRRVAFIDGITTPTCSSPFCSPLKLLRSNLAKISIKTNNWQKTGLKCVFYTKKDSFHNIHPIQFPSNSLI